FGMKISGGVHAAYLREATDGRKAPASRRPLRDVLAFADQRKAVGDGEEFAARLDLSGIEAAGEDVPHGRHEGGAAGEEHLVDLRRCRTGLFQHLVERALDAGEVRRDPAFEI